MSRETLARVVRRVAVLAATLAVIGVAAGTVQVAAEWRAASAPLDTAPVSMSSITQDYAVETQRADDLGKQMDGVAKQISDLQAALITADGSVAGDTTSATGLKAKLGAATVKLTTLQKQLDQAQQRLQALNRAAARQAAANRSTRVTTAAPTTGGGPVGEPGND